MDAPVYRNAEGRNTFLGLAFPLEVLLVMLTFWPAMLLGPEPGALLTAVVYVGLRLINHGRPEAFVQHYVMRAARRTLFGGRLSAAARSRIPACPVGLYALPAAGKRAGR
jgi:hypothetical protein